MTFYSAFLSPRFFSLHLLMTICCHVGTLIYSSYTAIYSSYTAIGSKKYHAYIYLPGRNICFIQKEKIFYVYPEEKVCFLQFLINTKQNINPTLLTLVLYLTNNKDFKNGIISSFHTRETVELVKLIVGTKFRGSHVCLHSQAETRLLKLVVWHLLSILIRF